MQFTTPQLFLFDLDGTLIDSRADLATATNLLRRRHGLPPLPMEKITSYVGDGIRMLAIRALEGAPVDVDAATAEINEAYAEHLTEGTHPYPGVAAGLKALHAAGHQLGLVTNKPSAHARRLFDHFAWTPLFAVLLGGGDTPELKPSPVPCQTAMERTHHPPETTWMIGDHHTDLEAARRANIPSIFLESGIGDIGRETPTLRFPSFPAFTAYFLNT
ncbi:MAG: HAD-IA family hydrolase [Verrucomicrobiota bacterium]|nr:HAD-IA family hydrolase [Verrucomicrobiota bacterium]